MIKPLITLAEAADFLLANDDFALICHVNPDGDTAGSAAALCLALRALGKRAQVFCSDPFPKNMQYLFKELPVQDFVPRVYVAVDVAAEEMLGKTYQPMAHQIALCIDHHSSNTLYAERVCLDPGAAANAELICGIVEKLGVAWTQPMADAAYTGIATDTACFRYPNTTPRTHMLAAMLMTAGARCGAINTVHFEQKTRARMVLEQKLVSTMTYFMDGRVSVMQVTQQMLAESGATQDDVGAIAYLTRQVEGVDVGLMFKEYSDGLIKVSARSNDSCNVSELCAVFGGGGHTRAAGCTFQCSFEEARDRMLAEIEKRLGVHTNPLE